jgi:parallel beta-helix repeat protein
MRVGLPSHPYSFLIEKRGNLFVAQDGSGRIRHSGADAFTVIQSAINTLTAGGKIFIKEGVYPLSSPLRPTSGITLEGVYGKTVFQGTKNDRLVLNANPVDPSQSRVDGNIVLRNLVFDMNNYSAEAVNLVSVYDSLVENCIFKNVAGSNEGLDLDNCYNIVIRGCDFYNIGGGAVHVSDAYAGFTNYRGCDYVSVVDCYARNCGKTRPIAAYSTYTRSTAIGGGLHIRFVNCRAYDCYQGFNDDIELSGGGYTEIINPTVDTTTYRGIAIVGVGKARIIGGTVRNSGSHGIYVNTNENVIMGVKVEKSTYHGISLYRASHNVIIGNVLKNNGSDGINLSDDGVTACLDNLIIGNRCYDDQATKTQDYGIREAGIGNYNIIVGNDVRGNIYTISKVGANTIVRRNVGYVTENSGTATIPSGQTSVTVAHGLAATPSKVIVTPRGNIGAVWVSARDATNITVNCSTAPAADTIVDWYAEV